MKGQFTQYNTLVAVFILWAMLIPVSGCGQGKDKTPAVSTTENGQAQLQEEKQKVINYLVKSVPEVQELVKENKDNHLLMEIQALPDPTAQDKFRRDYYDVYIGFYVSDGGPGHRSRWGTFLVAKDLNEILWADSLNNRFISLDEWRKSGAGSDAGQADGAVTNDWVCIPLQRAGPITAQTTEADLIRFFGKENVQRQTVYGPEGEGTYDVSVIFSETPNQVVVYWRNNHYGSAVSSVSIRRQGAAWKTVHGITIGTSLAELNRINGQSFEFFGFGWDYGGSVRLSSGGAITSAKGLYLVLVPVGELPREYYGDRTLDSRDHRLLPDAVRVGRINIDL